MFRAAIAVPAIIYPPIFRAAIFGAFILFVGPLIGSAASLPALSAAVWPRHDTGRPGRRIVAFLAGTVLLTLLPFKDSKL